jgi:MFS family permease
VGARLVRHAPLDRRPDRRSERLGGAPLNLLRERDLSLLVSAVGLSALGDWLALTPLALHLQEETGSGVVVALLFIAVWSPAIVLAGPAGVLADRTNRARLLLWVSLAQAAVAVALAFSEGTVPILVLAALLGSGFAFAQPAEFALVPGVAPQGRLAEANGLVETSRYIGFTAGPAIGGLLAAAGGMRTAMLVNAATFLAVAAAAVVLRPRGAPLHVAEGEDVGRAREGLVFLFRDRVLAIVMAVAFVSLLFFTASAPAEVFFAKDVLGTGDAGFGLLWTSWTLGMTIGALAIAPRVRTLALGALVAIVVQGLGLGLPTMWLVFGFALGWYLIGGVAHGTKNVLVRTLIHVRVPERVHGRAFAAYNGLRNSAELVAIGGGGILVAAIGARWTLALAGFVPALAGVAGLALAGRRLAAAQVPSATSSMRA